MTAIASIIKTASNPKMLIALSPLPYPPTAAPVGVLYLFSVAVHIFVDLLQLVRNFLYFPFFSFHNEILSFFSVLFFIPESS